MIVIFYQCSSFSTEGDPNNYLTFFKRGTVYLALGKAKLAISDLDRVLELKPDFTAVSLYLFSWKKSYKFTNFPLYATIFAQG